MSKQTELVGLARTTNLDEVNAAYSAGALSNRNLIINGAMTVAQRGTSFAGLSNGSTKYTLDRWQYNEAGAPSGVFTITQDTDAPDGFASSLKWDCTTADAALAGADVIIMNTRIEGQDLQQLNYGSAAAQEATMSFWVKSNKTGTYVVWLYQPDDLRSNQVQYTIDVADTWEKKTVVISADTTGIIDNDSGSGLLVRFILGSGTTYTSGTAPTAWEADTTANRYVGQTVNLADNIANYFNITGVQLEVGDTATPFEHRSFDQEHTLCQRYFQRYGGGDTSGIFAIGAWSSSSLAECTVSFVHEMRVPPTVTSPQLGRCLDVNVAWNNVTSIATIAQNSTKNTTLQVNTQTGTAAQGDSAQLGGGGNTFDYLFDSEL